MRTRSGLIATLLLLASSGVHAAPLTLAGVVSAITASSPQALVSQLSVSSALNSYKSQFAQALPQITLTADPAYGVNQTKAPILNQFGVEISNEEQLNQQVAAGISLSQALPTAGNFSLSLHNSTTIARTTINDSPQTVIYQAPTLSATLSQPLFVNGKLIDMGLFPATLKATELPYLKALQQDLSTRNSLVIQGISTYLTVISLRKQRSYQEELLAIQEETLAQTQLSQRQGRATENEVLSAQIAVDRQHEANLELGYSLMQSERALSRLLGLDQRVSSTELSELLPTLTSTGQEEALYSRIASENPDVEQARLDVENARVQKVIGGQSYAPSLSLSLAVAPKYGYNRPNSDQLDNSFSQLFDQGNGAYTDLTFSVGMQLPVYNGGRAKRDQAALEAGVQIAEKNLALKLRTLRDNLDSLLLKRRYLQAKLALMEENVTLEERRVADERRRLSLSSATALDVKVAEATLSARRSELWSTRVDRFVNELDLLSLTGADIGARITQAGTKDGSQ